ncbi:MAG: hypothetical protein ACHQT6_11470 [Candidatus Acidiferrales bacterium]
MAEHSDLAAQVDKLRRDILWTKCIAGLLILCLVAVVIVSRPRHPKIVEATQLILKDEAGNVVASLGKGAFGETCLTLSAKAHAAVSELCVADDGGGFLDLHDLNTESRATLTPGFTMHESLATHFPAGLLIEKDASKHFVNMSLRDETKMVIGHGSNDSIILSSPTNKPAITLFNGDGKQIWSTQ